MSDDKKLLSENTIRRFMTLASTGALSDNFIQETFSDEDINEEKDEELNEEEKEEKEEVDEAMHATRDDDEEEVEEGMRATRDDDEEVDEAYGSYARDDEEEPEMDMGDVDDMDADMGDDLEGDAADISLSEEEARLIIDLGTRLSGAMGQEGEEEPEMDMGAPSDEPEMDMGDEDEDMAMQEDIVQEVLKRVTKRIVAEKLKNRK